jgi:aspartyl-tRNA(Asn)/glutamyl-tRNA(Gln) amidotransferase subunit A
MSQPCKFSRRDMLRGTGASIALPMLSTLSPSVSRAEQAEATCFTDATGLAESIRNKELSPVELMRMHLDRVEAINPKLNAIVTLADGCLERARQAEKAVMRGELLGPLHGVPFTIKDVFDTQGVRTTRGSHIFKDRVPDKDATLVKRLKKAGGILLGKTNLPEFALSAETTNELFGRTVNPWNPDRTCGGSTGGEAAAIAAGLSPLGTGSDLGGSNRLPAHYCGIVGLKPTHGRIPLTGHWPELLARFMHAGPLARSVRDVALASSVMSGSDDQDPYAFRATMPEAINLHAPLPRLRVGWFAEGPFHPVEKSIRETVAQAASALHDLGCHVDPVSLPDWEAYLPIDVCYHLLAAEGTQYLEPYLAGHDDLLSSSIAALMQLPKPSLKQFIDAYERCEQLRKDLAEFFARFDLLLCPTAPLVAHAHDAEALLIEGQEVSPSHAATITASFGLTGSPAISVPFGFSDDGLPIGVQLVAHRYDEATLLHAASALETVYQPEFRHPLL